MSGKSWVIQGVCSSLFCSVKGLAAVCFYPYTVWLLILIQFFRCSQIAKYMQNTHAKTHSGYVVDIVQIFKVDKVGEDERFKKVILMKA